jgi:hypothetical protein
MNIWKSFIRFIGLTLILVGFGLASYNCIRYLDLKSSAGDMQLLQKFALFVGVGALGLYVFGGVVRRIGFWIAGLLAVLGGILLVINASGRSISLRNPAVDEGMIFAGKERKPLYSPSEAYGLLFIQDDERVEEYAYRLTEIVFNSTIHLWEAENVTSWQEYNHWIPIHENFILWFSGLVNPSNRRYEYCDPYRALQRGVSVCSQASKIIVSAWNSTGLRSQMYGLEGHVVAEVEMQSDDGIWWVLDGDYGVVLEKDAETLAQLPNYVRKKYTQAGYEGWVIENLLDIYGPESNTVLSVTGVCKMESKIYVLKDFLPNVFLIPLGVFVLSGFRDIEREED